MSVWKKFLWKIWLLLLWIYRRKIFACCIILPVIFIYLTFGVCFFDDQIHDIQRPRPKYLNITKFNFVQNNETICRSHYNNVDNNNMDASSSSSFLIIVIHSARDHFEYRNAIRSTWGSVSHFNNWTIRKVFILGSHYPEPSIRLRNETINYQLRTQKLIDEEASSYGDIIVSDFYDSYRNLTFKHLAAYHWILNYCSNATFVLKMDDDIFIDTFQLINYLDLKQSNYYGASKNSSMSNHILCHSWEDSPKRYGCDKWRISYEEYGFSTYPLFCIGAAYITTPNIIQNIFSFHSQVRFFWIDDIFMTGILRAQYNHFVAIIKSQYNNNNNNNFTRHNNDVANANQKNSHEMIEIENIEEMYQLHAADRGVMTWENNKIFYLLKRDEVGMNFRGVETYWNLSLQGRINAAEADINNNKAGLIIVSHSNQILICNHLLFVALLLLFCTFNCVIS